MVVCCVARAHHRRHGGYGDFGGQCGAGGEPVGDRGPDLARRVPAAALRAADGLSVAIVSENRWGEGSSDKPKERITQIDKYRVAGSTLGSDIETETFEYRFRTVSGLEVTGQFAPAVIIHSKERELESENGPISEAVEIITVYDRHGEPTWIRHPDNSLHFIKYESLTGRPSKHVANANPDSPDGSMVDALLASALEGLDEDDIDPSDWGRTDIGLVAGGELVQTFEYDLLGRVRTLTGPGGDQSNVVRTVAEIAS